MRTSTLIILLALFAAGCKYKTIAHNQDERAANRISRVLYAEGAIVTDKVQVERSNPPTFNVVAAANDMQRALEILERLNLPAEKRPDTCSLLADASLVPTPEQSRAKRICGISGDISNKLLRLDRIIDASVLVSVPEDSPLADPTEPRQRPSVSIIAGYLADASGEPPIAEEDIVRFAAAAVPGLAIKDISVKLVPAPVAPSDTLAANTCIKTELAGSLICAQHRNRIAGVFLIGAAISGIFAALAVFAALRALQYRRDLTRLTAQLPVK
jgi:type III secretion system YscJ/HrcJ family lipoprotein